MPPSASEFDAALEALGDRTAYLKSKVDTPFFARLALTGVGITDGNIFTASIIEDVGGNFTIDGATGDIVFLHPGIYVITAGGRATIATATTAQIYLQHDSSTSEPFTSILRAVLLPTAANSAWELSWIVYATAAGVGVTFRAGVSGGGSVTLVSPPDSLVAITRVGVLK